MRGIRGSWARRWIGRGARDPGDLSKLAENPKVEMSSKVEAGATPRPPIVPLLYRYAAEYRAQGLLLFGMAGVSATALWLFVAHQAYYWSGVILGVALFSAVYLGLDHHRYHWPSAIADRAPEAPAEVRVARSPQLVRSALLVVGIYGVVTFGLAIAATHLWVIGQEVGLLPGTMVAQGATCLYRAERLGAWERDHNAVLLTSGWRLRPGSRRALLRRSAAAVSGPSTR